LGRTRYHNGSFASPARGHQAGSFGLIVSEILLQRTRAETVSSFFPKFVREFPSWKKLGNASIWRLRSYLRPIGLWRRRAIGIRALAREMSSRNGRFPKRREEIEALPGIGQYIASAVIMFCHHIPQPLLDVNMARVLERVFGPRRLRDIRYDPYLQKLAQGIVEGEMAPQVNWAILDLGAEVCRRSGPLCGQCPLESICVCANSRSRGFQLDGRTRSNRIATHGKAGQQGSRHSRE
jgi:A/G-specific adenine glycosylase